MISFPAFLALLPVCIGISVIAMLSAGEAVWGIPVGVLTWLILGVWILVKRRRDKADAAENKSGSADYILERNETPGVIAGTNLDRFYIECVLSDNMDFTKKQSSVKAKLFADKYNLPYPDGIEALFASAKDAHEQISEKIRNEHLRKQREAERAELSRLTRYAEYVGKEKRAAMLRVAICEAQQRAHELNEDARVILSMGQQREGDWAALGGLADGIAGPAAGLAAAINVQAENAKIRAQNAAYKSAVTPWSSRKEHEAVLEQKEADRLKKELDQLPEKLLSDLPTQDVMALLDVTDTKIKISETGAIKITATVRAKQNLVIFEDTPAVADGTILAHVTENEQEIGTAKLVLPRCGVSSPTKVTGILLSGAEQGAHYTVFFTGYRLWLMEQ